MQSFKLQKSGGEETENKKSSGTNAIGSVLGLILILCAVWYFWIGGGVEVQTEQITKDINQQVISDTLQQYNIVKANGTKIDACVRAGLVAEAYLQAKDERNYQYWKDIEWADCDDAGVPLQ